MGKPMCYGRIAAILMVIAAVILQKRVSNIAIQAKKKALLHMGEQGAMKCQL
jgi:hypothetical protein